MITVVVGKALAVILLRWALAIEADVRHGVAVISHRLVPYLSCIGCGGRR